MFHPERRSANQALQTTAHQTGHASFLPVWVRQLMPLADQQTFKQNNLIISLEAQNNPEGPDLIGLNRF